MEYGPEFASLLRELRRAVDRTQGIGPSVGISHSAWQSYEQRSKLPSVGTLGKMVDELIAKHGDKAVPTQAQFVDAWLRSHGLKLDDGLAAALRQVPPPGVSLSDFSWLRAFAFTGERREQSPKTRLDCLIAPAAISDLRHLIALGLHPDTELVPDKELTARPWKELVRRYGDRDIVSISSGAVNAMTGLLNDTMVFRFDVMPEARMAYRAFLREMDHLENESALLTFRQCLRASELLGSSLDPAALLEAAGLSPDNPEYAKVAADVSDLLGGSTPTQFTSQFRQAVVDPLTRRRYQPEKTVDYAVVSLARHPFAGNDRLALVVAGTNGPATAGALQLLATGGLTGRPLGAVVSVQVRSVKGADGNSTSVLVPKVITPAYEPEEIVGSITTLLTSAPGPSGRSPLLRQIFGHWSDADLMAWKGLVTTLGELVARRD